ncbi:MAG: addiction module toxin, HicA family [Nitrospirae bacterium]|nr:MAG: addiction module toxin, HicA family [Nitrospirota bacterium]
MKRHALLAHLHTHGCQPIKKLTSSVPRHTEISNRLAAKICKDLGIPQP